MKSLWWLIGSLAFGSLAWAEPNSLTPEEESAGFQLLFDGKSLTGFRGFKQQEAKPTWEVVDGAITLVKPGGGDLISVDQFSDFEFRFEFKISPKGNSGIMWHVSEEYSNSYETGPEYQILDSTTEEGYPHEFPPKNFSGVLYALVPGKKSDFKGPNEWNQGIIRVEGSKITLTLNGRVTAEVDTESADYQQRLAASKFADWAHFNRMSKGHLAFQDHQDPVAFRSLRVLDLSKAP